MDMTREGIVAEQDIAHDYHALQELGDCYCSVDNFVYANQCYEKAALLEPDEAGPYIGLGVVAIQQQLLDDAQIAFKVARRLDPKSSKAYAGLAMVAQRKEDYKQAFEMYLKCLELDTDNLTALLGLFQASCQMGSFCKVTYYLETYLNMHREDTAVMFSLAALYMKDDKFGLSRKMLSDILLLNPDNEDAINLLEEVDHSLAQAGVKVR